MAVKIKLVHIWLEMLNDAIFISDLVIGQPEHVATSSEVKCQGGFTLKSYLSTSLSYIRPAIERATGPD